MQTASDIVKDVIRQNQSAAKEPWEIMAEVIDVLESTLRAPGNEDPRRGKK